MEQNLFLKDFKSKLQDINSRFLSDIKTFQTGRAHPSILDGVSVEVYETKTPLNQAATILAKEASVLQVTPFDIGNIAPIRDAIAADSKLNLNPTDDGRVIYIPIPPLTAERRQQIAKNLNALKEDFLVRLRQARHEVLKNIKDELTAEEEIKSLEKIIEQLVGDTRKQIEDSATQKVNKILEL